MESKWRTGELIIRKTLGPLQPWSRDHIVSKKNYIMGYNLKNARNEKEKNRIKNNKMTKFETPFIIEWEFMTVWILKGIMRRFVWKKLLKSNIFHTKHLKFLKIQTVL